MRDPPRCWTAITRRKSNHMKRIAQGHNPATPNPRPEQRHREAERQSNREPESRSDIGTERLSNRGKRATDETHATDDSALAAPVGTLQEAAQISLNEGVSENCLFNFARAVKAFEVTTGIKLAKSETGNTFAVWWQMAKPQLPKEAEFDEYLLLFEDAYARVKSPLGSSALTIAVGRAKSSAPPPDAEQFTSPKLRMLVAVCYQLQRLSGSSPFFLSLRDCARILELPRLETASAMLNGLVSRGILIVVEKGIPGPRRATRFRFRLPAQPK